MGYNPTHDIDKHDFTKDLAFGEASEEMVREFLAALSKGSFEVKSDRYKNGKMVIELEQNPRGTGWKPSGLNVTTAHWWVYMYGEESFVIVSVERLKKFIDNNRDSLCPMDFAPWSSNPARGYLLSTEDVLKLLADKYQRGQ